MSPILLGTFLMGYCELKWQTALLVFGLTGIAFGILLLILFRNSPLEDHRVNDAERELISEGSGYSLAPLSGLLPVSRAIRNRSLRFFVVQQFLDAGSDVAFVYLMGKFFLDRYQLKIGSVGWMSSLPLWGGAIGGIVGGWLNDRLISRTKNRRWSRSGIGFVGKVIGCLMLFMVGSQTESAAVWLEPFRDQLDRFVTLPASAALAAGIALLLAKFFSDWSQPTVWGACTDLGGRYSATVFSVINTSGTIGGIIMPIVFGTLLDWNTTNQIVDGAETHLTNWGPLFVLLASMYLVSGIFWLLIDCTDSLEREEAEVNLV
jgi:ACS family D-galactonate transporter-like MFS transporter